MHAARASSPTIAPHRVERGFARACLILAALALLVLLAQPTRDRSPGAGWRWSLDHRDEPTRLASAWRWRLPDGAGQTRRADTDLTVVDDAFLMPRSDKLEAIGSSSIDVGAVVPRVFARALPRRLPELAPAALRKQTFVNVLLPLVLDENDRIAADRARLIDAHERVLAGETLDRETRARLAELAERYRVDAGDFAELLRRVDGAPPSLALAQAALESGWGTSRNAQQLHNVFGKMVAADSGRYSPRSFDDLRSAVAFYIRNLNTNPAYADFRARRAKLRDDSLTLDGFELAAGLERYSERGVHYVRQVREVLRANRLEALDAARLAS